MREVASDLASRITSGTVVIHFAGAAGVDPLADVVAAGGSAAALHPVQACPDIDSAVERIPGSAWGVTVSPGLEDWARSLISDSLQGLPVSVAEADRPLWHAAAVTTSNATAALLAIGESILASISVAEPSKVLGPLARGTIANALAGGGGAATLTGPIVRGESETVRAHLAALTERDPDLVLLYRLAGLLTLVVAQRTGRIPTDTAKAMRSVLEP